MGHKENTQKYIIIDIKIDYHFNLPIYGTEKSNIPI